MSLDANKIEKRALEIGFKRLSENAILPTKANPSDSGLDLYAAEDVIIAPGETAVVKTNLAVQLPPGYECQVRPRSGITSKTKLRVQLGTIDESYRGEIGIIVDNTHIPEHGYGTNDISNTVIKPAYYTNAVAYLINKGDKIAQLVVQPIPQTIAVEIDELTESDRGTSGFGSSGVRRSLMTQVERKINVLDDKGYVIIHDVMGTDLTVENAARVSYAKKSQELTEGSNVHLIADESLGGVLRESVEVERKADVGDFVSKDGIVRKVTNRSDSFDNAVEFIPYIDDEDDAQVLGWQDGYYKTLEPTDIVVIDGKRYCIVERKAEVGEKVIIVKAENTYGKYRNGSVIYVEDVTVYGIYNDDVRADDDNVYGIIGHGEYRVLEPVEPWCEQLFEAIV